jgi:hypothetical protein
MPLALSLERCLSILRTNVSRKEFRPAWCAQGFCSRNRRRFGVLRASVQRNGRRLGDAATSSPRIRLDLGATRVSCEENVSTCWHGCPVADITPRLGEPGAPLLKNSTDLVRSGLPREEKVLTWWRGGPVAEKTPRLGRRGTKSRRYFCNGASVWPTRCNIFARVSLRDQLDTISLRRACRGANSAQFLCR